MHGAAPVLSPLSTYAVKALAANAAVSLYGFQTVDVPILGLKSLRRSRTRPLPASAASVGTSSETVLGDDANRTGYVLVNLGNNPLYVHIGEGEASATNGLFISANGGTLVVNYNSVYVVGPASARPEPRDRNPATRRANNEITAGAATRADTVDATYTVPAGKKAIMFVGRVATENRSTTALNGPAHARISYSPSGGGGGAVLARADLTVGEASNVRIDHLPNPTDILSGDSVNCQSFSGNSAVGSDVRFQSDWLIMEYDA